MARRKNNLTPSVLVKHDKTKAEGLVPITALKAYESQGWKAVEPKEVKAVEKALTAGEQTPQAVSNPSTTTTQGA